MHASFRAVGGATNSEGLFVEFHQGSCRNSSYALPLVPVVGL